MDSVEELQPDDAGAADHDLDEVPVAGEEVTTEEYVEKHRDTKWVVLPDEPMKVEVVETTPYKLLAALLNYGLDDLLTEGAVGPDEVGPNVDLDDLDVDTGDAGGEDILNLGRFMRDFVIPRVITPDEAYWGDEPDDVGPKAFDLSELSETDMNTLIGSIAGQGGVSGFRPEATNGESAGDSGGASSP